MKITELLQDYNVPFSTEGKNIAPGWIGTTCPFCDDPSEHLGYNLRRDYFSCWRCGWKPTIRTLVRLLHVADHEARRIMRQYGGAPRTTAREPTVQIRRKAHRLPTGTGPLMQRHRLYLEERRFDPDTLIATWGLLGTGPVSMLDETDYKWRIIAPISWDGRQVSFQGRDVTGRSRLKYKACPKERELMDHKAVLYGRQDLWRDTGICVEGITDVWRLGPAAFATLGVEWTVAQLLKIRRQFRRVHVLFDNESKAQERAERLVHELRLRGVEARRTEIEGDPGGMAQDDADHLVRELLR